MVAWATPIDILDSWIGDDAPTDTILLEKWIDKAEREIRFRVPGIQARITAAEVDLLANVVDVVSAMVSRKIDNPKGIRQSNTTTGPFTESQTFGGNDPGELALLPSELSKLSVNATVGQKAYSASLIPTTSPFYVAP